VKSDGDSRVWSVEVDSLSGGGYHQCLSVAEDDVLRAVAPRPSGQVDVFDRPAHAEETLPVHAEPVVFVGAPQPERTVRADGRAASETGPYAHRLAPDLGHFLRTKPETQKMRVSIYSAIFCRQ